MNQAESHTFEEWNELGFFVRKCEKAAFYRYGRPFFTEEQVEEKFDDYEDVSGGA